jgi:hypothetical protein
MNSASIVISYDSIVSTQGVGVGVGVGVVSLLYPPVRPTTRIATRRISANPIIPNIPMITVFNTLLLPLAGGMILMCGYDVKIRMRRLQSKKE